MAVYRCSHPRRWIVGVVLPALALAACLPARHQVDPHALLQELQDRYANLEGAQFQGERVWESEDGRRAAPIRVTAAFGSSGRIRQGADSVDSTLTIHDGHQTWRYWPRHRQYVVSTDVPTAAESPLRWLLDLVRGVASATYQRSEVLDVDGVRHRCYVVDVTYDRSPSELPRLTEARLWVDEETRLVVQSVFRVLARRSTGETVIGEETTIWTDRRMSPPQGDLFAFHPQPGDVRVEEFHEPAAAAIGTSAPEFAGVDLDGRDVSLSSLRGRVVVLAFWASWCLPCEPELRLMARFQSEFRDDGLVVLGINGENETVAR